MNVVLDMKFVCVSKRRKFCKMEISIFVGLKGGLAQLARAPALQAGGQRFDSVILHGEAESLKQKA